MAVRRSFLEGVMIIQEVSCAPAGVSLVRRVYIEPWTRNDPPIPLYFWTDGKVTHTPTYDGSAREWGTMAGDELP